MEQKFIERMEYLHTRCEELKATAKEKGFSLYISFGFSTNYPQGEFYSYLKAGGKEILEGKIDAMMGESADNRLAEIEKCLSMDAKELEREALLKRLAELEK